MLSARYVEHSLGLATLDENDYNVFYDSYNAGSESSVTKNADRRGVRSPPEANELQGVRNWFHTDEEEAVAERPR